MKLIPFRSGHRDVRPADMKKHQEKHEDAKWGCEHWSVWRCPGNNFVFIISIVDGESKMSATYAGIFKISTQISIRPRGRAANLAGSPSDIENTRIYELPSSQGRFIRYVSSTRLFSYDHLFYNDDLSMPYD